MLYEQREKLASISLLTQMQCSKIPYTEDIQQLKCLQIILT